MASAIPLKGGRFMSMFVINVKKQQTQAALSVAYAENEEVAKLQDLLIYTLKGISIL